MSKNPNSDDQNQKDLRREYPSGWLFLTRNESVQYIIDALLDYPPYREFNQSELAEQAGVSRQSVAKHLGTLLELDILEEVNNTHPQRYRFNQDSPVSQTIIQVDGAVSATLSEKNPEKAAELLQESRSTKVDQPDDSIAIQEGFSHTILVVEDEPQLAELYANWLSDDFEIRIANTGEEAIQELSPNIDVVLLDRRIPDVSGDKVLQAIRSRHLDCQVAIISAVEPDLDIIDMEIDDYMVKPIAQDELNAVVDSLLTRHELEPDEQEYLALYSKKAALDAAKDSDELNRNDEYLNLKDQLSELRNRLGELSEARTVVRNEM